MTMTHPIPNTILAQLGGNRFVVMTGARNLIAGEDYLGMALPTARHDGKRVTHVRVTLDPSDTYTVEALSFNPRSRVAPFKTIVTESGVYCDNLQAVFTDLTGLATHL